MQDRWTERLTRAAVILIAVLILKVNAGIVLNYGDYFPANFQSDFLFGREETFYGAYQWAFYTHILAGPPTLVFGLLLISDAFRRRFAKWHRRIGKAQVFLVLMLLAPSGFWMAQYAAAGRVAAAGFTVLSMLTGLTAAVGWRMAVQKRFAEHRVWMQRCFVLLCSTVLLRLIGGLGVVLGVESIWYDALNAWLSWLLPLTVFEVVRRDVRGWHPVKIRALFHHPR